MICDPANITCPEASPTVSMLSSQMTDISKDVESTSVVSSVYISSPITVNAETNIVSSGIDSSTTALYVSPNDIVTLPKATPRKKKMNLLAEKEKLKYTHLHQLEMQLRKENKLKFKEKIQRNQA